MNVNTCGAHSSAIIIDKVGQAYNDNLCGISFAKVMQPNNKKKYRITYINIYVYICALCGLADTTYVCEYCKVAKYCSHPCKINDLRENHAIECKKLLQYANSFVPMSIALIENYKFMKFVSAILHAVRGRTKHRGVDWRKKSSIFTCMSENISDPNNNYIECNIDELKKQYGACDIIKCTLRVIDQFDVSMIKMHRNICIKFGSVCRWVGVPTPACTSAYKSYRSMFVAYKIPRKIQVAAYEDGCSFYTNVLSIPQYVPL